jgi:hypothetical protein
MTNGASREQFPANYAIALANAAAPSSANRATIQLVLSSLAKGFNCFSSVETRLRKSFMTLLK